MLTDNSAFDRARRICDLLGSYVPDERLLGLRELSASLDLVPEMQALLLNAIDTAIERVSDASLPALQLPETDWAIHHQPSGLVWATRRLQGHTLVVKQSGGPGGWFYPVVNGHHPSASGRPWAYPAIEEAFAAAEREVLPSAPPHGGDLEAAIDALLDSPQ